MPHLKPIILLLLITLNLTATGATTSYTYDNFGNKISSTNEYGETTNYEYDGVFVPFLGITSSKGNLLKETQSNGTIIEHIYDENSNLLSTQTTTAEGIVTTSSHDYDAFNRLISSTDIRGNSSTNIYDARGNKTSTTDAQNRTTTYTYSPSNKITKTLYADGTSDSKTYDAMDNILSETNTDAETTTYEYDKADRLIKTTYADNTSTSSTYDKVGRILTSTDQNGNTTTYEYDAVGNQIKVIDALGNETTFTYDAQGNRLSQTNALNQSTTYEYNALNQRIKTTYADGTSTIENKNISGLPTSKTDEAGTITSYGYDTTKNIPLLNSVTLANGAITSYTYDSQNRKSRQTDALNHSTNWDYTDLGELNSETLPKGEVKTFSYDAYGKQTQINDYANKAIKFIYDSNDKLVRTEYADGSTITYDYTPSGRLKSQTNIQGTISNTYNSMGRLKTQTNTNNDTITYTYDAVGNITLIETPTQTISKTYTVRNRLESVTDAQGTTSYTYDELGRQIEILYPNNMTTAYEYDTRNRIIKISHINSANVTLQSFTYTLNEIGNKTKIVQENNRTVDYEYSNVNQLTKETITNDPNNQNTITAFEYDLVGNLKTKTIDQTSTNYTYNENDQLTSQGAITFTYDDNGNLLSKDNTTYTYDDKNRLTQVQTPTQTIEYSYDANNNRIAKVVDQATTTYLIDTNTPYAQVITENKNNGSVIEYTYGNDLLNNGSNFFLTDALGSTRGLVDSSENLTDSYTYTPYGKLLNHNGTSENDFLYTGEQFDSETEDYFLRARYYSPDSGRFLTRDSYDGNNYNPISQNHYLYGGSNPIKYTDPNGHFFGVAETTMTMNIISYTRTRLATSFTFQVGIFYSMRAILNLHNFIYGGSVLTFGLKRGVRWGFWRDLPKFIYKGTEYAIVKGRLYTEHAVNRMTPRAYGMAAGRYDDPRGIPTMAVEFAVQFGKTLSKEIINGGIRYTRQYGEIFVIFEKTTGGREIIISVIKKALL